MNWDWQYWRIKQLRNQMCACEKIMRDHNTNTVMCAFAFDWWQRMIGELQELQLATLDRSPA